MSETRRDGLGIQARQRSAPLDEARRSGGDPSTAAGSDATAAPLIESQPTDGEADLKSSRPWRFYKRMVFHAGFVFVVGTVGAIAERSLAIFAVGLACALCMLTIATWYRRRLEYYGPDNWRYSWTALWRKLSARE